MSDTDGTTSDPKMAGRFPSVIKHAALVDAIERMGIDPGLITNMHIGRREVEIKITIPIG